MGFIGNIIEFFKENIRLILIWAFLPLVAYLIWHIQVEFRLSKLDEKRKSLLKKYYQKYGNEVFQEWLLLKIMQENEKLFSDTSTGYISYMLDGLLEEERTGKTPSARYNSYKHTLREYYRKYGNHVLDQVELQSEIHNKYSDITLQQIQADLNKICEEMSAFETESALQKTGTEEAIKKLPSETDQSPSTLSKAPTPPQNQPRPSTPAPAQQAPVPPPKAPNKPAIEEELLNYLKAQPICWEFPLTTQDKALNKFCEALVFSDSVTGVGSNEAIKNLELTIQKKRARNPRLADHNAAMEGNILAILYEYSYLMHIFHALDDMKFDTTKVDIEKLWLLIQQDCNARINNLDEEKRKNPTIQIVLDKYNYDHQITQLKVLKDATGREMDYIISFIMAYSLLTVISLLFSNPQLLQPLKPYSADDIAGMMNALINASVGLRFTAYSR